MAAVGAEIALALDLGIAALIASQPEEDDAKTSNHQCHSRLVKAMATGSKKLTMGMVQEIGSSISEELLPGFPKEVLEGISTAAHVKTFEDRVIFIKTLQRQ